MPRPLELPLFPLPDVVHFPRTDLRLHIFEPRYRQLVRDLLARDERDRWVGMVLLRSDDSDAIPEISEAGTAGRLVSVDYLSDGRSNILLRGGFRFSIEREVGERPYRVALVHTLPEPELELEAREVQALQRGLVRLAGALAAELGERFPVTSETVCQLAAGDFEETVNGLAADLDVPALRKLQLLVAPLAERAEGVSSILRARRKVLDLLRPFRALSRTPEQN